MPSVLEVPWGKPVKPEQVKEALMKDDYKAVTVTHVETSTGVENSIKEIGEIVMENSDAFYIVDTVCSLGGMEVRVDEWNIDICASGSQKCIGVPPGLALLSVSDKVLKYIEKRKTPPKLMVWKLSELASSHESPITIFCNPAS
ncbi:MAG: aminotransferase class V-fold PLP-dependent enzyme [Candidatus Bathyarchaeota archaeon]|nr:aminotransferase class V-fold PLP-dependent enzyme [Candidatus Bathyarchaeota archaeon]